MRIKIIMYILLIGFTLIGCKSKIDEITPYRGKVKYETVSVNSKIGGRIDSIYVTHGQLVSRGDTLAKIYSPEVSAKMQQALGAIYAAQGQLDMANNGATQEQINQLNSQIEAAKYQLQFAEESLNRIKSMYQDSLVPAQRYDEVKMKRDMAQAKVDALESKYDEIDKGTRQEVIAQAKGQLDQAYGAKREVESAAEEMFLYAPSDMTIETISLHEGELLTPGYTLFNGYDPKSLFFRFTVPESKIYNFKVGQEVIIENPYTHSTTLTKVQSINQLARYADITSTSPLYELSETIYELRLSPTTDESDQEYYLNAMMLIKE